MLRGEVVEPASQPLSADRADPVHGDFRSLARTGHLEPAPPLRVQRGGEGADDIPCRETGSSRSDWPPRPAAPSEAPHRRSDSGRRSRCRSAGGRPPSIQAIGDRLVEVVPVFTIRGHGPVSVRPRQLALLLPVQKNSFLHFPQDERVDPNRISGAGPWEDGYPWSCRWRSASHPWWRVPFPCRKLLVHQTGTHSNYSAGNVQDGVSPSASSRRPNPGRSRFSAMAASSRAPSACCARSSATSRVIFASKGSPSSSRGSAPT